MDATTTLPTCYRHPDRETRLACSQCGRPTCIDCVKPAPVGQKCLECSAPTGRTRVITARDIASPRSTPVSYGFLGISVALFLIGLVIPDAGARIDFLGVQSNAAVAAGEWYRLLTAAFLHDGPMHILFNMYALSAFGPQLERQVGSLAFALLYLAAAAAGGAAFYLFPQGAGFAVGASGAIFGLFGAYVAHALPARHTAAGRAGLGQLLTLLAINLALPLIIPNIAWQAHVGGLVVGFAIAWLWDRLPQRGAAATLPRAAIAGAVLLLSLAVVILA